jgi:MFS family permease
MVISVVVGRWSDRTGRRKPFVIGSSVMMAGAVLVFALGEDWTAAMLAGAVLGLGYGSYLAIDNALITEVLPDELSRGKDLGLISVANTGSQALAPAIAGPIVAVFGYSGLYVTTGAVILIGAALIQPVRSVR